MCISDIKCFTKSVDAHLKALLFLYLYIYKVYTI
nr:MAG TPA: hypothetical protein [Caudoviricetes sp.]